MLDDRRTEPPFRINQARQARRYLLIALGVIVILALGYVVGRPAIHKWRYKRDMARATEAETAGDYRTTMLILEQLNRLHARDAEVRRRLAAFYQRAGQVESVAIWREAVELDPTNADGQLGLAKAAVQFGDRQTAREVLDRLAGSNPLTSEYHRLRAGLALLERDAAAHEQSLAQLAQLEPDDKRVQLNLATVRLTDPHGPKAPMARAALVELARNDRVRMRAVAELLGDVARRWPGPAAGRDTALRDLAAALTPARGPLLAMPSQDDPIERLVQFAMEQPAPEAEDVVSLANWMSLNGQTETALQWIDTLPARLAGNPLLRTAHAEFAIRVRDWDRLRVLLLAGAWGPVPAEVVQQAFRAQAHHAGPRTGGLRPGWASAVEAGKNSMAGMRALLRLAELWGWRAEQRMVLLTIARLTPRETWAWRQLISLALEQENTEQLWQVYVEWRLAMPGELTVQVESAIIGHLLGRRRVPNATETAGYIQQQPLDPGARVAHALALWKEQRVTEAAAVIDGLVPEAMNDPRYALAAGIVLASAGRAGESEARLHRVPEAVLLGEERVLLHAARARNRGDRP